MPGAVKNIGNIFQSDRTIRDGCYDVWLHFPRKGVRIGAVPLGKYFPVATEDHATSLRSGKSCFGSLANHSGFVLGEYEQDLEKRPVGVRRVARDEGHTTIEDAADERDVPGEPV